MDAIHNFPRWGVYHERLSCLRERRGCTDIDCGAKRLVAHFLIPLTRREAHGWWRLRHFPGRTEGRRGGKEGKAEGGKEGEREGVEEGRAEGGREGGRDHVM